jgi:hypothetical protein
MTVQICRYKDKISHEKSKKSSSNLRRRVCLSQNQFGHKDIVSNLGLLGAALPMKTSREFLLAKSTEKAIFDSRVLEKATA